MCVFCLVTLVARGPQETKQNKIPQESEAIRLATGDKQAEFGLKIQ